MHSISTHINFAIIILHSYNNNPCMIINIIIESLCIVREVGAYCPVVKHSNWAESPATTVAEVGGATICVGIDNG